MRGSWACREGATCTCSLLSMHGMHSRTRSCIHSHACTRHAMHLRFLSQVEAADEWEDEIDDILSRFEAEAGRKVVYTILYY